MSLADLKQELHQRVDAMSSVEELRELIAAFETAIQGNAAAPEMVREERVCYAATAESGLADDKLDEVLGYRPNGEAVTLRNAVPSWEAGLQEVLDGGGYSIEEVLEMLNRNFGPV